MTTGVWENLKGESIIDSAEAVRRTPPTPTAGPRRWSVVLGLLARLLWAAGLTQRGKPPRDQVARVRRQLLMLVLGWGLAGAGMARAMPTGMAFADLVERARVLVHLFGGT